MGKKKSGICYLCGKQGVVTHDHVFPKNLFSRPLPSDLITAPACAKCNGGLSLDEEYFRICVLTGKSYDLPSGRNLWNSRVRESFKAKPGLKSLIASQVSFVTGNAPSGRHVLPVLSMDRERVERVVRKVVKGLHFHHRQSVLADDISFEIFSDALNPSDALATTVDLWQHATGRSVGGATVTYRYAFANDNQKVSIWWLLFFNSVLFTVVVGLQEPEYPLNPD